MRMQPEGRRAQAREQNMSGIFISYRRDDSAGHAGRLFDRLREKFAAREGVAGVFMDVEGIAPGTDFVRAIHKAVGASSVVLAVVGPVWRSCTDAQGRRRLDDPEDFVRLEIASALRLNKVVIPVLVHDAAMPTEDQLPIELKSMARLQAVTLTDTNWESDVGQLVNTLRGIVATNDPSSKLGVWPRLVKILSRPVPVALLVALLAGAYAWRALRQPGAHIALSQPDINQRAAPPPAQVSPELAAGQTPPAPAEVRLAAAEGNLLASSSALEFGALRLGDQEVQAVRITNSGHAVVALSQVGFAGDAQDDFSFERKCERKELTPNAVCDLRVRFTPSEPGPRKALLSVEYVGRSSPLIVKLWGNGTSKSQTSTAPLEALKAGKFSSAAREREQER